MAYSLDDERSVTISGLVSIGAFENLVLERPSVGLSPSGPAAFGSRSRACKSANIAKFVGGSRRCVGRCSRIGPTDPWGDEAAPRARRLASGAPPTACLTTV